MNSMIINDIGKTIKVIMNDITLIMPEMSSPDNMWMLNIDESIAAIRNSK